MVAAPRDTIGYRWARSRTCAGVLFTREALELAQRCHVEEIALIGSLVAEVPHTKPIHVTGTSNHSATLRRFKAHDVGRANYNGSTGILTALHELPGDERGLPRDEPVGRRAALRLGDTKPTGGRGAAAASGRALRAGPASG